MTGVAAIGLAAVGLLCCLWSWSAYTYLLGAKVTILPGTSCLTALQTTTAEVTCPDAMWLTGTTVKQGTLIDYRQSGGEFEYDEIPARIVGDTARTQPSILTYRAGLAGPVLLVVAVGMFVVWRIGVSRKRPVNYYAYR